MTSLTSASVGMKREAEGSSRRQQQKAAAEGGSRKRQQKAAAEGGRRRRPQKAQLFKSGEYAAEPRVWQFRPDAVMVLEKPSVP